MAKYIILKTQETQTIRASLCDDGIVRVVFKKDSEIDLKDVKQNYKACSDLVDGKHYAFLYSPENNAVSYTDEALNYAKDEANSAFPKICIAVVVKTLAQKLLTNFYIKFFNKPSSRKTFNDYSEAEKWCLIQYQEYQLNSKTKSFNLK